MSHFISLPLSDNAFKRLCSESLLRGLRPKALLKKACKRGFRVSLRNAASSFIEDMLNQYGRTTPARPLRSRIRRATIR